MRKKWQFVYKFDIFEYKAGIRVGDKLRLKKVLECRYPDGKISNIYRPEQGVWEVLPSSKQDPVVRLWNPMERVHTWDDNPTAVFEWFEIVDRLSDADFQKMVQSADGRP